MKRGKSAFVPMLISWLIPGYGFMRNGHWKKGLYFFVILELTFLLGAALRGAILIPTFAFRDPTFNLVNILTFITQIFNGGLSLLSALPELFGQSVAILPYEEDYVWADLGNFFLLVSGGMSYFVLVRTWDHFYAEKKPAVERTEA